MANICSTCKYNGGCFADIRETFNIPETETTPGFWDSLIFCKSPDKNTRLVLPAKTLKDCNLWEANDGHVD
jgi:hypothetical protein